MGRPARPLFERFWEKVEKESKCWLWHGTIGIGGYGKFDLNRRKYVVAHRYSYELCYGKISRGVKILHRCDVPNCVRPSHLFPGTNADNTADMWKKGRAFFQKHPELVKETLLKAKRRVGENSGTSKLKEIDVREIFKRKKLGERAVALAEEFNISATNVQAIMTGRSWKHLGLR